MEQINKDLSELISYDLAHHPDETVNEIAAVLGGFFVACPEKLEDFQGLLKEYIRYFGNPKEYLTDYNELFYPQMEDTTVLVGTTNETPPFVTDGPGLAERMGE